MSVGHHLRNDIPESASAATKRRQILLAQMYEAYKRGEERNGIMGATLWGASDNQRVVGAFIEAGLAVAHEYPGRKPYLVATLTDAGIDEGRAALAMLYLSGERDPAVDHHWLPEWMSYQGGQMTFTQQKMPKVHPANLTPSMVYIYSLGGWAEYHEVVAYMLVEMYHHSPMEMTWGGGYGVVAHRMCKAGFVRILHSSGAAIPDRHHRVRIGLTAKGREEAQVESANRLFRGEPELRKVVREGYGEPVTHSGGTAGDIFTW